MAGQPRTTRGGQPWYSALAITTALTLWAVFRLALRQTEGLIGSILRLPGLDLAVPDHSTLSRRAETLEVPRPRSSSGSGPVRLLVNSTGLRLCGPGEWLVEKHGTRARRSWRKLHIGVDTDTGRIGLWQGCRSRVHTGAAVTAGAARMDASDFWMATWPGGPGHGLHAVPVRLPMPRAVTYSPTAITTAEKT